MSDLTDFLLAAIAEDERRATAACAAPWQTGVLPRSVHVVLDGSRERRNLGYVAGADNEQYAEHIATWHPERALAECGTKRRILGRHAPHVVGESLICGHCSMVPESIDWPCADVLDVASVFADRRGYLESWRP